MTPRSELNQMIIVANNTLKHRGSIYTLELEKYNGYAITCNGGLTKISPRMSIKNLTIWLDGFISGLEF
jgi:hypothetical protein